MKVEIESMLAALVGLAMTEHNRAVDMEMFRFGHDEAGGYALHVQCPWRIERSGSLVVGYRDMRDPPTAVSREGWDPNEADLTHRDELLGDFFAERQARPRLVVEVEASNTGDVRLVFDDGCVLAIFPDSIAIDDEYWRLLKLPRGGDHLVVGGSGSEHSPADASVAP